MRGGLASLPSGSAQACSEFAPLRPARVCGGLPSSLPQVSGRFILKVFCSPKREFTQPECPRHLNKCHT